MWLAVGTEDGCIHTLCFKDPLCHDAARSGPEAVTRVAALRGHAAPIFDVSFADALPCKYLLSVDTAGQALAFDVPMARRLPSVSAVRSEQFSPWTAPIGWPVLGCWSQEPVAEGPGALPPRRFCEARGRSLVAATAADDFAVELYPFPCPTSPARHPPRLIGPSSPISALWHGLSSNCLLGASETALFVWTWGKRSPGRSAYRLPLEMDPQRSPLASPDAARENRSSSPSPLRPSVGKQPGGAVLDTPDGPKRIMPVTDAGALEGQSWSSPQHRTPLKVRPQAKVNDSNLTPTKKTPPAKRTPPGGSAQRHQSTPVGGRHGQPHFPAAGGRPGTVQPRKAWEAAPRAALADRVLRDSEDSADAGAAGGYPDVAPLPGSQIQDTRSNEFRQVAGPSHLQGAFRDAEDPIARDMKHVLEAAVEAEAHTDRQARLAVPGAQPGWYDQPDMNIARRRSASVSGTAVTSVQPHSPGEASRAHEDNFARAKQIHHRHQADTVRSLLSGGKESHIRPAMAVVAPLGQFKEAHSGRYQYRVRDAGDQYEVEAHLPGGRLLRVLRNPLQRTLTFEGEVVSHWALGRDVEGKAEQRKESLVVQVPAGFDLQAPPGRVERNFVEGRCLVAICKRGFPAGPGAGRAVSWEDAQL